MDQYEQKLKEFIQSHNIKAEHLSFQQSCHSVDEAAKVVNAMQEDFLKSICMIGPEGKLIVAIVKGEDRASTTRVAKALNLNEVRIAKPYEMLEKSGYPCGGTPPLGFDAIFLIDQKVMESQFIYGGGGSEQALIKISPKSCRKLTMGR